MHKLIKLIFVCFVLIGCTAQNGNGSNSSSTSTDITTTTEVTTQAPIATSVTTTTAKAKAGELIALSVDDTLRKLSNKETFIVYLGTTTCSACIAYKPVVEETIAENNVIMYAVMLDDKTISADMLASRIDLKYTPTTLYIKDGEVVDRYDFSITKEELIKFYKDHDLYDIK